MTGLAIFATTYSVTVPSGASVLAILDAGLSSEDITIPDTGLAKSTLEVIRARHALESQESEGLNIVHCFAQGEVRQKGVEIN